MSYERIKKNWEDGLLTLSGLKIAYQKGIITKEQYREIKELPQKGSEAARNSVPDEI